MEKGNDDEMKVYVNIAKIRCNVARRDLPEVSWSALPTSPSRSMLVDGDGF